VLAGFDGTMLALGAAFAVAALKMRGKAVAAPTRIRSIRAMEAA
jgi:hypothetical protein